MKLLHIQNNYQEKEKPEPSSKLRSKTSLTWTVGLPSSFTTAKIYSVFPGK